MYLIVMDELKAQKILKTNRTLKIGDKFEGTYESLSSIFDPEAFSWGGEMAKENKVEKSDVAPKNNKKLQKNTKYKSK